MNNEPRHQALVDKLKAKAEDSVVRSREGRPASPTCLSANSPTYSQAYSPAYTPAYSPVYSPADIKVDQKPPRKKAAKLEDSRFSNAEDGGAATRPILSSQDGATAFPGISKAKKSETKREETHDPYALGETVKGEPSKHKIKDEAMTEDDKMDISTLRVAADDDNDAVSESNLSDVLVVDEYPEVELAKTEHILERMGTSSSPGVIELCDDIVLMLNPVRE